MKKSTKSVNWRGTRKPSITVADLTGNSDIESPQLGSMQAAMDNNSASTINLSETDYNLEPHGYARRSCVRAAAKKKKSLKEESDSDESIDSDTGEPRKKASSLRGRGKGKGKGTGGATAGKSRARKHESDEEEDGDEAYDPQASTPKKRGRGRGSKASSSSSRHVDNGPETSPEGTPNHGLPEFMRVLLEKTLDTLDDEQKGNELSPEPREIDITEEATLVTIVIRYMLWGETLVPWTVQFSKTHVFGSGRTAVRKFDMYGQKQNIVLKGTMLEVILRYVDRYTQNLKVPTPVKLTTNKTNAWLRSLLALPYFKMPHYYHFFIQAEYTNKDDLRTIVDTMNPDSTIGLAFEDKMYPYLHIDGDLLLSANLHNMKGLCVEACYASEMTNERFLRKRGDRMEMYRTRITDDAINTKIKYWLNRHENALETFQIDYLNPQRIEYEVLFADIPLLTKDKKKIDGIPRPKINMYEPIVPELFYVQRDDEYRRIRVTGNYGFTFEEDDEKKQFEPKIT